VSYLSSGAYNYIVRVLASWDEEGRLGVGIWNDLTRKLVLNTMEGYDFFPLYVFYLEPMLISLSN
jgi:hypothetical protein